ncbi:DUF192 domain-containing protein [Salinibaculum rarum]|uniref:DUF192 domain-containing protein n=1 Tax=Salinibaculum rarum TaxID=3058903 RepID=UPI00265E3CFE|nr:DUF192 domain-containing protein [Salinibaculum sp. KK48]
MNTRRAVAALAVALVALAGVVVLFPGLLVGDPGPYNETTVTVTDENGTELGTVAVRIADTGAKRYTGLSETDSLAPDDGMLFVHDEEGQHSYVMRGMSFPLDIIFVDADGTVVEIFHASVDSENAPYEARGKYVLEVNRGWANRNGVTTGDRVVIPDSVA